MCHSSYWSYTIVTVALPVKVILPLQTYRNVVDFAVVKHKKHASDRRYGFDALEGVVGEGARGILSNARCVTTSLQ